PHRTVRRGRRRGRALRPHQSIPFLLVNQLTASEGNEKPAGPSHRGARRTSRPFTPRCLRLRLEDTSVQQFFICGSAERAADTTRHEPIRPANGAWLPAERFARGEQVTRERGAAGTSCHCVWDPQLSCVL
uniref:Uncharacterized protein n=1 Tax=Gasterosteus aculeatus TaxID=69293 RepID=G3P1U6_GASAC